MERGDPVAIAQALLQLGVQEQDILKNFLERLTFGTQHVKLAHQIQDAAKNKDPRLNSLITTLRQELARFDDVLRYAEREDELRKQELTDLAFEESILQKEVAETQQAFATGTFGPAVTRRLSEFIRKTQNALEQTQAERTVEKRIEYAVNELRHLVRTEAGLIAQERERLDRIGYGDLAAAEDLVTIASAIQFEVIKEKTAVIDPLNVLLKKKIDIESMLNHLLEVRGYDKVKKVTREPITLADIQQDMRSFTTPDEVAQYALKLLRYSASVDPAALETLSRYGLQSQYRSNLLRELTDAFTGIANKKHFNREIVRKLQAAEEAQKPLSLILFDIDKFKPVNDTYGHAVGDVVLKSLVGVVRTHIKQADFFARIGGEEFAIIVFGGHDVVAGLAERLRTQVAETMRKVVAEYRITDRPTVTISLGTATYNGRGERLGNTEATHAAEALIGIADKAQYLSKVNRNTLTIGAEVTARELIH